MIEYWNAFCSTSVLSVRGNRALVRKFRSCNCSLKTGSLFRLAFPDEEPAGTSYSVVLHCFGCLVAIYTWTCASTLPRSMSEEFSLHRTSACMALILNIQGMDFHSMFLLCMSTSESQWSYHCTNCLTNLSFLLPCVGLICQKTRFHHSSCFFPIFHCEARYICIISSLDLSQKSHQHPLFPVCTLEML